MRRMTFDLEVLRTFVQGVELGSFAKAADRAGRSTSAVSAQIKKLESQLDVPVLRKSGRGLVPTPAGERLLGYAKRLLELNDEASTAVRGADLRGSVRLGLQEDFGEYLLTAALSRFARSHPHVHIEAHIARNAELIDHVRAGRLDLALAWGAENDTPHAQCIAQLPMRWIGRADWSSSGKNGPLPLVAFESPCVMRSAATGALDRAGIPWRVAFTSPSLSGIWAAARAGLGITVRTSVELPAQLAVLQGLPDLPSLGLNLHWAEQDPSPPVRQLGSILHSQLMDRIPA